MSMLVLLVSSLSQVVVRADVEEWWRKDLAEKSQQRPGRIGVAKLPGVAKAVMSRA